MHCIHVYLNDKEREQKPTHKICHTANVFNICMGFVLFIFNARAYLFHLVAFSALISSVFVGLSIFHKALC